jgi:signal transduction histidine kinase
VIVRPIIGPSGAIIGALKLGRDVTFEYELAQLKEQFVRVTSHELRTPAAILRLAANRLLDGGAASPAEVHRRAETIDRATRRIESIALKLVDIAALSSGEELALEPGNTDLSSLVADVVAGMDDAEAARVRLSTVPALVHADAKRLREVIEALLDNALRYSIAPAPVEVRIAAHDHVAEVSIADHGVGIPAAKQPHVFEQFYRAHSGTPCDRGGLGASLYLASRIIKAHGGRLWFESRESAGSTFHVALEIGR